MLVSLLFVAASVQLPSPAPFDSADSRYAVTESPPIPPLSINDVPLNVTLEDGSVEDLFEGDIMLTREQRLSRKGSSNTWSGGVVPFVITASSAPDRAVIIAAIQRWESATCISFDEKPEGYSGGPHLKIFKGGGCWSYVGRVSSGGQSLSIGKGCAYLGTVVHELGHAIGFWHEQSRRDRDSYISVLEDNIISSNINNFRMASSESSLGVQYDIGSIMHYSGFAFTKNGLPTIVTNDLRLNGLLGNREGLSHRDKQLANLMYSCDASCVCPPICRNGGYLTESCECACPPGSSGDTCATVTGTYYPRPCGDQDITSEGSITSPNYPKLYPPGEHCVWIIKAPEGKRVQIEFSTFKIIYRSGAVCYWDWLAVHMDGDPSPELVKCGSELQNQTIVSEGKRLALELHAFKTSYPSLSTGFEAEITFVDA